MPETYLSIVVPVYNEEGAIAGLHQEILETCQKLGRPFEIIFVNDGSRDKTLSVMKGLSPLKIINFRRNFGQTAAMDAGIKAAQGYYIAALDGDGQNDPANIPMMIEELEKRGLDVLSGWRNQRKDTFMKKISSRAAAFVRKHLINDGIHDSGCTLKIYKKECFEHVDLYGEMHRFIPALLKIRGFKIGEMPVNHRPRTVGQTKYNWVRGLKGILDMLAVWFWSKYANRPLHLFGTVGVVVTAISILFGLYAIFQKIYWGQDLSETALTELSAVGFIFGIQFIIFGLICDILIKNYHKVNKMTVYDIKEVIENV